MEKTPLNGYSSSISSSLRHKTAKHILERNVFCVSRVTANNHDKVDDLQHLAPTFFSEFLSSAALLHVPPTSDQR